MDRVIDTLGNASAELTQFMYENSQSAYDAIARAKRPSNIPKLTAIQGLRGSKHKKENYTRSASREKARAVTPVRRVTLETSAIARDLTCGDLGKRRAVVADLVSKAESAGRHVYNHGLPFKAKDMLI